MSPGCTVARVSTKLPRCRYVRLSLANQCGWVGINGAKCNSDLGNAARVLMQRPANRMNDFAGFVLAVAYSPDFLHIDTVSLRIFAFPKAEPTYSPLRYENVGFPASGFGVQPQAELESNLHPTSFVRMLCALLSQPAPDRNLGTT